MKARQPANDNAVQRARLVWEQRAGSSLADEDLRELSANLTGFFSILAEWNRKATADNDNGGEHTPSNNPETR
jgi:hypothetical protein